MSTAQYRPYIAFKHHLGINASLLEVRFQGHRIIDNPHRRQLLTGFGLAYDHRPLPMQIDPDKQQV